MGLGAVSVRGVARTSGASNPHPLLLLGGIVTTDGRVMVTGPPNYVPKDIPNNSCVLFAEKLYQAKNRLSPLVHPKSEDIGIRCPCII